MISNWEDSAFDLRRRRPILAATAREIVLPDEVAAALRELQLLDTDCERLVFRIRARSDYAILAATDDDLDELTGFVAAEANHQPSRRRQQRLDAAFDALSAAARTPDGW
jgi:plasmid stabilization system protein ParE